MDIKKKCQPHLWLLTGTGEGHRFVESLLKEGWKVTVSVVSQRATLAYEHFSLVEILVGPLKNENEIRNIILNARFNHNEFHCVVDLTHPFAVKITPAISRVCRELKQPFIRYERSIDNVSNAFLINSFNDLDKYDLENKSIFFAIGVRHLKEAIVVAKNSRIKAYARILSNPESLKKALASSIIKENIAVLNPLSSSDGYLEKALIRKWKIDGVVCRQSGGANEILWHQICSSMGIDLWLLARPSQSEIIDSIDTYEKLCERLKSFKIK